MIVFLLATLPACFGDVEKDLGTWRDKACECAKIECACEKQCAGGDASCTQQCNAQCSARKQACVQQAKNLFSEVRKRYSRFQVDVEKVEAINKEATACLRNSR